MARKTLRQQQQQQYQSFQGDLAYLNGKMKDINLDTDSDSDFDDSDDSPYPREMMISDKTLTGGVASDSMRMEADRKKMPLAMEPGVSLYSSAGVAFAGKNPLKSSSGSANPSAIYPPQRPTSPTTLNRATQIANPIQAPSSVPRPISPPPFSAMPQRAPSPQFPMQQQLQQQQSQQQQQPSFPPKGSMPSQPAYNPFPKSKGFSGNFETRTPGYQPFQNFGYAPSYHSGVGSEPNSPVTTPSAIAIAAASDTILTPTGSPATGKLA